MNAAREADIIIIGAGFGGLSAAARAVELGLKPLVLEKGGDSDYPCNSRYSGGFVHIALEDPTDPPEKLNQAVTTLTGGTADAAVAKAFTEDGKKVIDWLRGHGVQFIRVGHRPTGHHVMAPPRPAQPGLQWKGRGPDRLLRNLAQWLSDRGCEIILGTRASELKVENGHCVGVIAEQGGATVEFRGKAVIIADGGFQANPDLLKKYICARPDRLHQRNARSGTGDGLMMAEKLGARLVGMDCFYGHPLHGEAFTNDLLWPYPQMDSIAVSGLIVDSTGRRYVDEGMGGTYIANMMARRPDPSDSFVIFDETIWTGPAGDLSAPPAPNPSLKTAKATMHSARTIPELAKLAGLPAETLARTIAEFNAAVAAGTPENLDPPRSLKKGQHVQVKKPYVIEKAPFYAMPMCPGITYTMGGLATDIDTRVLHNSGAIIPGLFAVGSASGGLEGGPGFGYFGGVSKAVISGLRAAECIARENQAAAPARRAG
jgi:fumarate reductase flavoprotein subunit